MPDPLVFDDGVRFTQNLRVRVPPGFRERVEAAAAAEGLAGAEFCRRAIAERIARTTEPGGTRDTETRDSGESR
ncbi:hypothetical protein MBRA_06315 [Methylobacterium brachiatum]|nr:hypothetical protein MBRA_06315 [Methylobacterium brachiatum]